MYVSDIVIKNDKLIKFTLTITEENLLQSLFELFRQGKSKLNCIYQPDFKSDTFLTDSVVGYLDLNCIKDIRGNRAFEFIAQGAKCKEFEEIVFNTANLKDKMPDFTSKEQLELIEKIITSLKWSLLRRRTGEVVSLVVNNQ